MIAGRRVATLRAELVWASKTHQAAIVIGRPLRGTIAT